MNNVERDERKESSQEHGRGSYSGRRRSIGKRKGNRGTHNPGDFSKVSLTAECHSLDELVTEEEVKSCRHSLMQNNVERDELGAARINTNCWTWSPQYFAVA
jgi:hypothetical protein